MSLYRKHRPQKFIDLVGQEHICQVLTNALAGGNFSHAYLFYGSRGSGKTTTARLLAKALNCTGRPLEIGSFEPCNKCSSCQQIVSGSSLDVIEIDAASNRGIDEIRELREKIRFAPTISKYKVYVIDECHMLTKEAFNALLKTLEEPPKHAVFILATTELHKVPATILSRTQVFDFKKASIDDIVKLLKKICLAESVEIEESALRLIAKLAYGAFRDAISMLDQVASIKKDQTKITLSEVQHILGQTSEKSVWDFVEQLSLKNRNQAIKLIGDIYFEGKDLENFTLEVVRLLRKIILLKVGLDEDIDKKSQEGILLLKLTNSFSMDEITTMIEKLFVVAGKVKSSSMGQLPLEMFVFEFTLEPNKEPLKKVENIIKEKEIVKTEPKEVIAVVKKEETVVLEKKTVEEITPFVAKEKVIQPEVEELSNVIQEENNQEVTTENVKIEISGLEDIKKNWPEVFKKVKIHNNTLAALFGGGVLKDCNEEKIVLTTRFKFHADQLTNSKNLPVIESAIAEVFGRNYKLECTVDSNLQVSAPKEAEEELLSSAKEVFGI